MLVLVDKPKPRSRDPQEELVDTLLAISLVAKRLAAKLEQLDGLYGKGGKKSESDERAVPGCDRVASLRRCSDRSIRGVKRVIQ